jgi:hypothetical protein
MNSKLFVEAIKVVVAEHATESVLAQLASPPGRRPSDEAKKNSEIFCAMNDEQKNLVGRIASIAAEQAAYNFLCLLDGISFIEDDENKGSLRLYYLNGNESILLNSEDDIELTSLYKDITL